MSTYLPLYGTPLHRAPARRTWSFLCECYNLVEASRLGLPLTLLASLELSNVASCALLLCRAPWAPVRCLARQPRAVNQHGLRRVRPLGGDDTCLLAVGKRSMAQIHAIIFCIRRGLTPRIANPKLLFMERCTLRIRRCRQARIRGRSVNCVAQQWQTNKPNFQGFPST